MSSSAIITLVLALLAIIFLPQWKYSRMWGGGFTPSIACGAVLLAHMYTVFK